MAEFKIDEKVSEYITLDALLKAQGIAQTGGHAKIMIKDGEVKVDSQVETRRGRKLFGGEVVEAGGVVVKVVK